MEMDETYVGGRRRRAVQYTESNKTIVVGMVERKGGRVKCVIADDTSRKTLHDIAKEYVLPKSVIFTDDHASYHGLEKIGYNHDRINHSQGVYVYGNVHTNTIEGFWSLVLSKDSGVW